MDQKQFFFAFVHRGSHNHWNGKLRRRILFNVIKANNYQGLNSLPKIKSIQYFLVNSNYPEYAMVFKIAINEEKGIIRLTLNKYLEQGNSLITKEEIMGLEFKL